MPERVGVRRKGGRASRTTRTLMWKQLPRANPWRGKPLAVPSRRWFAAGDCPNVRSLRRGNNRRGSIRRSEIGDDPRNSANQGSDEPPCGGNMRAPAQSSPAARSEGSFRQAQTEAESWPSDAACFPGEAGPQFGSSIEQNCGSGKCGKQRDERFTKGTTPRSCVWQHRRGAGSLPPTSVLYLS